MGDGVWECFVEERLSSSLILPFLCLPVTPTTVMVGKYGGVSKERFSPEGLDWTGSTMKMVGLGPTFPIRIDGKHFNSTHCH